MDRVFSEFLNRKFLSSQAMAKRLNQEKRKLPQSFVLSILPAFSICSFFKSYKFPENNPLPCVFACLTWVVDVARIRLGEFVETLYSE